MNDQQSAPSKGATKQIWRKYRKLPVYLQLAPLVFLVLISFVASTLDRTLTFQFAGANCVSRPTLLPGLFRSHQGAYSVRYQDEIRIGGWPLAASKLCVAPLEPPQSSTRQTVRTSLLGVPFLFQKGITVHTKDLPRVDTEPLKKGVPTTRPLILRLSQPDTIFEYVLMIGGETTSCKGTGATLACDLPRLQLDQAKEYEFRLERSFEDKKAGTAFVEEVRTLSPVSVASTSIQQSETVVTKPTSVIYDFDKGIVSVRPLLEKKEGDTYTAIPVTFDVDRTRLTVQFAELPRSSEFRLTLHDVIAVDGSTVLSGVYEHHFAMSGGPKVTGVNIGRSGVGPGVTVVVNFDQPLSATQDVSSLVQRVGGIGAPVKQGNTLRFSTAGIAPCSDFSLSFGKDIQNEHGVGGDSTWAFSSRTLCQVAISIGTTAQGRAITGYKFGNGSQTILFLGLTHGNEKSTYSLLSSWIDELEANARTIPGDKSVIVIPALSRDGLVSGQRRNANNVDLNRNFPTADWKSDVTMPGGELVVGGGGSQPLSEPETQAIAAYTQALSPYLVMTYHAIGGLVTPNEAGGSVGYANTYSSLSGYRVSPKSAAGTTFEYDTTGAYEDWLYEKPGVAALLVEMASYTSTHSSRHFPAMWAMVR